jgi:hypothetical protein
VGIVCVALAVYCMSYLATVSPKRHHVIAVIDGQPTEFAGSFYPKYSIGEPIAYWLSGRLIK